MFFLTAKRAFCFCIITDKTTLTVTGDSRSSSPTARNGVGSCPRLFTTASNELGDLLGDYLTVEDNSRNSLLSFLTANDTLEKSSVTDKTVLTVIFSRSIAAREPNGFDQCRISTKQRYRITPVGREALKKEAQ